MPFGEVGIISLVKARMGHMRQQCDLNPGFKEQNFIISLKHSFSDQQEATSYTSTHTRV